MTSAGGSPHGALTVELAHAGTWPLFRVGGKALNLGKLAAAGLPVPPGFCLGTAAYLMAVPAELETLAAQLDEAGPEATALEEMAQQARDMVATAPVPPEVDVAVRLAYAAMGSEPAVAVRSSATAEDLPFASFAGQQDSYLNIVGADAVVQAVRRCWSSLWTHRAVAYRAANGISNRGAGLAVVVQEVVDAATAGVMFTANPVTGTRGETVIDASPGPGQAVVSGAVNPDHFVVETATARIIPPGPNDAGRKPCLAEAQLRELTSLGGAAQRLFGAPQDVEWVIDAGGKVWLTQSRPITTLYPLPDPSPDPPDGPGSGSPADARVYLCGTLLQGLTRPITPMGLSVLGRMRDDNGPWRYASPGLRMYVDLTPILRSRSGRRMLLKTLPLADGRSGAILPALLEDPRFGAIGRPRAKPLRKDRPKRPSGGPRLNARTAGLAQIGEFIPGLLRALFRPQAELRRARNFGQRLAAGLALPEPASAARRLEHTERIQAGTVDGLIGATLPGPAAGYAMLGLARRLLRGIAEPRELEAVLRGLPHNVTTEMDLELWQLAVSIRQDPGSRDAFARGRPEELAAGYRAGTLPAVAQAGVRGFLDRYGHRAVAEIDLGMPRWSEQPDHILGMISNYLRVEDPEQAPDRQFARAADHAEASVRSLVDRARARSRLRGRLVALCLRRARQLAGLRELPKFYIVVVLGEMHRQLAAVGAQLARDGSILSPEDVFFLEFDEVRVGLRGADLRRLVADRRRLYDVELRRKHIPRLLLSDGTDVEAAVMANPAVRAKPAAPDTLTGTPASAGTVTGKVRVILDPVGARLEPGEILVAPSTDPGWTPLFMTAGALVMEMGGVISHGAVVAREYGIPAVVGVPDATTRLRTGQTVTVDGASGIVTP